MAASNRSFWLKVSALVLLVVIVIVWFSGCNISVVRSPAPWLGKETIADSSMLTGRWLSEKEKTELVISRVSQNNLEVEWRSPAENALFSGSFHKIGDQRFLQIQPRHSDGKKPISSLVWQPSFLLFKIGGLPENLKLIFPDSDLFAREFRGKTFSNWRFGVLTLDTATDNAKITDFLTSRPEAFPDGNHIHFKKRIETEESDSDATDMNATADSLIKELSESFSSVFRLSNEKKTLDLTDVKMGLDMKLPTLMRLAENETEKGKKLIRERLTTHADILDQLTGKLTHESKMLRKFAGCLKVPLTRSELHGLTDWRGLADELEKSASGTRKIEESLKELLDRVAFLPESFSTAPAAKKITFFPGYDPIRIDWLDAQKKVLAWAHLSIKYPEIRKTVWGNNQTPISVDIQNQDQAMLQAGFIEIHFIVESPEWKASGSALKTLEKLLDLEMLSKVQIK